MSPSEDRGAATATFALRDRIVRFERIRAEASGFDLEIDKVDDARPWGGFVRFTAESVPRFLTAYWQTFLMDYWRNYLADYLAKASATKPPLRVDAKLLLVAPGQRLSLQSHKRRAELWRVLEGPVVIVTGDSAANVSDRLARPGEVVRIECGQLHRLAAPPSGWGVVAEIWLHEDPENPSDENDITRYDDDYSVVASDHLEQRQTPRG